MRDPSSEREFPRAMLAAAAALVGLALVSAAVARLTGVGTTANPTSVAVQRLDLRFQDRADGAVEVFADDRVRPVEVLAPGTNGFVRGVLRGLVRARRARGIGPEPAFQLVRWADGRLSLDDPSTGRTIELGAFGPDNSGAFVSLLAAARGTP